MIRSEKFIPDFPIAQLSPGHTHPFAAANPRKSGHDTDIEGLAHSIHEQGVLQPLRVFPKEDGSGDAWVYIGERRLLASQMNLDRHADGRTTVPVLWVERHHRPRSLPRIPGRAGQPPAAARDRAVSRRSPNAPGRA
jgi:hypothetical protein